jgi:hypothetical protein
MPDKLISKDQEMQDAEHQSDVEAEEISSSAETSDLSSPSPKTPSNALGTNKTTSLRGAKIFSNIRINQVSRQKAYGNIPSKRPIGFEFQAGPRGYKKATAAFKAARDLDESRQAEEKVLKARQCLISAANLLGSRPNEQSRILELTEVMRKLHREEGIADSSEHYLNPN